MAYISFSFLALCLISLVLYYVLPVKIRWVVLLVASLVFYYREAGVQAFFMLLLMSSLTYFAGMGLDRLQLEGNMKRIYLMLALLLVLLPLVAIKSQHYLRTQIWPFIVPLGLSFFSLQLVAYLVDIYKGKSKPQKNIFKFTLFATYFPQIIQGPIPRYEALGAQLEKGKKFDEKQFHCGFMLVVWGLALKLLIADKAGIVVDEIFDHAGTYLGMYMIVGGLLYSVQLYADFLSCVCICSGVSEIFGITLGENFAQPYSSESIKEFWVRWHISLSSWLRDYVYIPLGGNRKGKLRKYLNLMITFGVSGFWHGNGYHYIAWGLMHAFYQILEELTAGIRARLYRLIGVREGTKLYHGMKVMFTTILVAIAWIMFRAENTKQGLELIASIFTVYNPWILFNDSLLALGLDWKEWNILLTMIILLGIVGHLQRKYEKTGANIRDRIYNQPIWARYALSLVMIAAILTFGTYGYGYDARDFIYGGF